MKQDRKFIEYQPKHPRQIDGWGMSPKPGQRYYVENNDGRLREKTGRNENIISNEEYLLELRKNALAERLEKFLSVANLYPHAYWYFDGYWDPDDNTVKVDGITYSRVFDIYSLPTLVDEKDN